MEKNIPRRRFKEFVGSGDWEEKKLGDFVYKAVDNRGKTPPLDNCGKHPLIEVASLGDIHPNYCKVDKYINEHTFKNKLRDYIKKDDILFSTVGSIGEVSLMDDNEDAAIAQNIVAFRAKQNYLPKYLYPLFSTQKNKDKAYRIVMGAVQPSIKVSQLINIKYYLTNNLAEQEKIGYFFQKLDRLIEVNRQKLGKLKASKSAYLTEMFPGEGEDRPRRRFQGFTGEWEEKKLGEVGVFNPKENLPQKFKYIDLESVSGIKIIDYRKEKKETAPSRAQRLARKGDLFYQMVRPYQKNNCLFNKSLNDYVFSTGYAQIRPYGDGYFLLSLVQNDLFVKLVLDRCTGTGYPAINSNDLAEINISIPSLAEQEKIGNFFQKLDDQIGLQEEKLEKLEKMKKAYLAEMFV